MRDFQKFPWQKFYRLQQFLSHLLHLYLLNILTPVLHLILSSVFTLSLQSPIHRSPFPSCAPLCEPSCDAGYTPACAPAVRRWRHAGLGAASPASSWRKLLRQRHSRCSGSGYFRPGDVRCGRSHGVHACSACGKSGRQSPVEP